MTGLRSDIGLLRRRPVGLLFTARTISVLGTTFTPLALAFGVLNQPGAGPTDLSLALAAQAVPQVLLMLVGGVIADRWSRFQVLVTAETVAGAASAGMALVLLTGAGGLGLLCVLAVLSGAAGALFLPAFGGVVPEVVGPVDRQAVNGLLRFGTNLARIGGLTVAGATVAFVGPGWALVIDSVSFFVSAVLLAGLQLPSTRSSGRNMWHDLRIGWHEFASRQWLWSVVTAAGVVNAAVGVTFGLVGPVVANAHLGGALGWSVLLAAQALGLVTGVVLAIRIRPGRPVLVAVLSMSLMALTPLLLLVGAPLPLLALAAFAGGVALDVFGVLWETTFQREVPAEALSRVNAYEWLGSLVLGPIALFVAGPLVQAYGTELVLFLAVAAIVLATVAATASPAVRALRVPAGDGSTARV